jgi:hypothetical protein
MVCLAGREVRRATCGRTGGQGLVAEGCGPKLKDTGWQSAAVMIEISLSRETEREVLHARLLNV